MESKTQVQVNRVLLLEPKPDDQGTQVVTDQSGTLITRDDKKVTQLETYAARRSLVAIEFDPSSHGIVSVYPPKTDMLQTLGDEKGEGDSVLVHAQKSPTLYYLRKDHPRFAELYTLLRRAHDTGKAVAIAIPPGAKYIYDARLVDKPSP
jgi:hypothetical protein